MQCVSSRAATVIHPGVVPRVVNHRFREEARQPQPLPGATGYTYFAHLPGPESPFWKQLQKNQASVEKVCALLSGRPSHEGEVGASYIARPGLSDAAKDANMAEAYSQLHCRSRNGFESINYLKAHFACDNVPLHGTTSHVDIKTGMCLFSRSILTFSPGHEAAQRLAPPLPNTSVPTLYELEIICRTTSAIADLVGLVRGGAAAEITLVVHLDLPDFQYYWSVCELFQQGLASLKYVQNWIHAIDTRTHQLTRAFASTLQAALGDRGLAEEAISLDSGKKPLVALLKKAICSGRIPTLAELLEEMARNDETSAWSKFYGAIAKPRRPVTVADLGRLLYVYSTVKDATDGQHNPGKRLIVQVDDASEWRIFRYAKLHLKTMSRTSSGIIGLFPLPKLLAAGVGRSELYHHCFGELSKCYLATAFSAIRSAYGSLVADRLEQFYAKERQMSEHDSPMFGN